MYCVRLTMTSITNTENIIDQCIPFKPYPPIEGMETACGPFRFDGSQIYQVDDDKYPGKDADLIKLLQWYQWKTHLPLPSMDDLKTWRKRGRFLYHPDRACLTKGVQ